MFFIHILLYVRIILTLINTLSFATTQLQYTYINFDFFTTFNISLPFIFGFCVLSFFRVSQSEVANKSKTKDNTGPLHTTQI